MQSNNNERLGNRGTILIASNHALFADVVGEMVVDSGFGVAYVVDEEAPWLSLTRTQPCIVICDCAAPAEGIQRLIVEASVRDIPLVLSDARMQRRVDEGSLVLPQRVAWLTFPVSRIAFAGMLDALLSPSPADAMPEIVPLALVPDDHEVDTPALADARDLRSVITTVLASTPIYAESLRRAVWTYVGAEHDAGTSPGDVIVTLTELVDAARIVPVSVSRALVSQVTRWAVEAYFGQLGCDVGRVSGSGAAQPSADLEPPPAAIAEALRA